MDELSRIKAQPNRPSNDIERKQKKTKMIYVSLKIFSNINYRCSSSQRKNKHFHKNNNLSYNKKEKCLTHLAP
jgi:hypothetical protein